MSNETVDQLMDIAEAIVRGEVPEYKLNETFTAGAFDLLIINKRGAEAFNLLQHVCQRYRKLKATGHSLEGYFYLLTELARRSDTTEMPAGLANIIHENPDLGRDLKEWYRELG